MSPLQDRRVLPFLGGGVALLLAVLLGLFALRAEGTKPPAQADKGVLQLELGKEDPRPQPAKPLRCFANGQFVGMATVAECAKRNGVSAQALDVGLDPDTGQVAAASGGATVLKPLPPGGAIDSDEAPLRPVAGSKSAPLQSRTGPGPIAPQLLGECLRYAGGGWSGAGGGMPLGQCARTLYDGRCVHAGEALYGRWGSQTLRLVPGRVEISPDNRAFHTLVAQDGGDCSLPAG